MRFALIFLYLNVISSCYPKEKYPIETDALAVILH